MAVRKTKRKSARASADEAVDTIAGELDGDPTPAPSSLGMAIEAVREALSPYDSATRKKIVRASEVMLKE